MVFRKVAFIGALVTAVAAQNGTLVDVVTRSCSIPYLFSAADHCP